MNMLTENKMTKTELVEKIYAKAALPSKSSAEEALDAIVETISDSLEAGDSVTFTGFGSFKVVDRAARKGRNPKTKEEIDIPASRAVKFVPGKALKEAVNKGN